MVMLDYSDMVGRFPVWSPKGQLFALNQFVVSADFAKVQPRVTSADFHVLYPLLSTMNPSNIILVLHPGDRAHGYFLMDIKAGNASKQVKVFQEAEEIALEAIATKRFPVIHFGELQKAVVTSRANKSPLSIRLRYLELRPGLPDTLLEAATETFIANATATGDKGMRLEYKLAQVDIALKRLMVDKYLAKCVWLDPVTSHLGKMMCNDQKSGFAKFITGDAQITAFGRALERRADGSYEAYTDFANVLPTMLPNVKWNSPTVHVYDEDFRTSYRLHEYYSLYEGLKALANIGAPVLLHKGYELPPAIPVQLLRPIGGPGAGVEVREFPMRHVVWDH